MLALCSAALLAGGFWVQFSSAALQTITARKSDPVRIVFFTKPALRFSYTAGSRKVILTKAPSSCTPEKKENCFKGEFDYYYIPKATEEYAFWQEFKQMLAGWRYNPGLVFLAIHAYFNALAQHRTDIMPAQAVVFSLELIELSAADFAIEQPAPKKRVKQTAEKPREPALVREKPADNTSVSDQPLKVIILNASGKKGQAESLKQYLRAQHAKGLLQVDVYDTGNYPSQQETSFIEDYSGRLVQVTQLSHALGIRSEIRSAAAPNDVYYDSRIVLGKDFKMPL